MGDHDVVADLDCEHVSLSLGIAKTVTERGGVGEAVGIVALAVAEGSLPRNQTFEARIRQ